MSANHESHQLPQSTNGTTNGTRGHYDVEKKQPPTRSPLIRSPFTALVQDFSPLWFTWCMNSGIIAILLHQHPYQFEGIRTLAIIAFVIDLILFVVFSAIFLLRLAIFRGAAFHEIVNDISQLVLLACWVIGFLTIAPNITLLVSQAYWGGYWATMLAYVLWWIGALWMLVTLFFVFAVISHRHLAGGSGLKIGQNNTHANPVPTLVIIPAVGVATVAVTGGLIVSYSSHMNARLAVPIIITAFPLLGLGMALATMLYAILWRQLLETGFPAPDNIASLFVYIGPFGQSAAALQALGDAARSWFGEYNRGTFLTMQTSIALDTACVLGGLLLLGPAVFFTLFSIYGILDRAIVTKQVRWTPTWNAIIFPTATMTTATTFLSTEMDSPTFRVLTSIQLILLVIIYFVNVAFTFGGIWRGKLLIVREDPRVKKQIEEDQKER